MKPLEIGILISFLCSASSVVAQSEEYWGTPRTYTTADVLAVLGKKRSYTPPPELLFSGEAHAGVTTSIKCGQISTSFDVMLMFDKLKQVQKALFDKKDALVEAFPLLVTCYMSPSICAELKNLNARIDQELKGLTDICTTMDNYINSQATSERVRDAAEKRGWRHCVDQKYNNGKGLSMQQAVEECNTSSTPMLHTDIAKAWIRDEVVSAPQNILESLLEASGQNVASTVSEERYKFLAAVLGELKLDVNGKLLPVFPARPLVTSSLAKKMFQTAITMTCDPAQLSQAINGTTSTSSEPEVRYFENHLFELTQDSLETVDHQNLFDLDPPDRDTACNALGRSLGKTALLKTAAEGEATAVTALQNPALPEDLRKMYESRITQVFAAMRAQAASEQVKSIGELKVLITKMAALQREIRRDIAGTLTKGQMDMEHLQYQECDSDQTCGN